MKVNLATETKNILKKYGLHLNKRLGQHYLIDDSKRQKILSYADLKDDDVILEIGPGIGTLTIPIASRVEKVIAIEKDKKVATILKERLKDYNNVELIIGDALKIDFPYFNKIVSNLPYKISSPITFKLLEYDFKFGILMYQREFAERMIAKPGTRDYSRLSVALYFMANIEILDYIPRSAFLPPPKVDSTLIRLTPREKINGTFERTCRALFQHKKKKARNALIESFHEISKEADPREIVDLIDPGLLEKRVFTLTPEEILKISNELKKIIQCH
ncbi:16S rRNA (adenine(1518)-N(6)/adenine(1519)-N(6))-dimethyltransferase RsmA [Methanothermobacter tenebrarum]|uniref:Probable ribosomal RNA small subunit methyltransferase A n=1 Tax=Methanothermobacter tenebrarum TaxID=680118 RepID=A0A328PIH7_9EURY|nr:16S rRNA (adenine(1518)-N(6)/adenine(1519)-N(6))-dimethyltransferase RsmA [Methanothermobacter tenebrarum]MBC7100640.1 16S ribosomal RNA methyltransferase A [Methanobacteriales archaeon]MBC7118545.1 16S ribosomal RNA methyltransferase A [Methanobacteriaceae archaeon]NPV65323.1 16S ribosomal RNA methyltransferase A [Methanobacteriaceae archaeon]RAO79675.1 16S rRNA (adenine(1518)-N(6)/adenine(1519)-N(6))-dimethyltransferase [Methanothermobacter tenebrarum]